MKSLFFIIIILIPLWGNSQDYHRTEKYCYKYNNWFANDTVKWNKEDSLAAFEDNKKLYGYYKPLKEFYYNGKHPYDKIYDAFHYDTSLLFYSLKLYAESRAMYDQEIAIPIGLVVDLINRDGTVFGTVVDKINHYPECNFFLTTYFVRTDSVIFSYFPINKGDTILIHTMAFGYEGYCQHNEATGYSTVSEIYNYKIGDSDFCFPLTRKGYVRHFQSLNQSSFIYLDPFCTNSFTQYMGETKRNCIRDADPEKRFLIS